MPEVLSWGNAFWVCVINTGMKGLKDIRVVVIQTSGDWNPVKGLTNADGWFGVKCNYGFRAEIFLNNKSYGICWCENGERISITFLDMVCLHPI